MTSAVVDMVEKERRAAVEKDARGLIYVPSRMEHEKIIIAMIIYAHCCVSM